MKLCKLELDGAAVIGVCQDDQTIRLVSSSLPEILHSDDPAARARQLADASERSVALSDAKLIAPIDQQEIWGAGVTYKRSQIARREESEDAGSFYDKVYVADRPELFFKATPNRVVGPGGDVRLRKDTSWCVPEPELTLVINPSLEIVGFTVGDDVSCRDIEGTNPLYLPQAKMFLGSCALGPVITLADSMPPLEQCSVQLEIRRAAEPVFEGSTQLSQMARTPEDLVSWLGREQAFPDGVLLLTGTGIVPPDEFTLECGDQISISITGIGTLRTGVASAAE